MRRPLPSLTLRRLAAGLALLLALPARSSAQATPLLDPTDPVHEDVDFLVAHGLVDRGIVGQRPYTAGQVARWVDGAARRIAEADASAAAVNARPRREPSSLDTTFLMRERMVPPWSPFVRSVVTRLQARFARDVARLDASAGGSPALDLRLLARAAGELAHLRMPDRRLRTENGVGSIAASINPLAALRGGRPLGEGATLSLETEHALGVGRWLSLVAVPRFAQARHGSLQSASLTARRLAARAVVGNLAAQVGREHLLWGQGRDVGLLLSANAPALDAVLLTSERPFVPPWLFRHLGPTQLSLFVARLDGAQTPPRSHLIGYKASVRPARALEMGVTVYTKGGGEGGPPATLAERVADAIPIIDVVFYGDRDFLFSDKYAGAEARLELSRRRGTELYGELLMNDFDAKRIVSVLTEDAGHVLGLWMPRLDDDGSVSARLEYRHQGIRQYRHHIFPSGQVLRGELLGDPLGPDAQGGYATLGWRARAGHRLFLDLAAEQRRGDEYADRSGGGATISFYKTLDRPDESRQRALVRWQGEPSARWLRVDAAVGIERVGNWDFEAGRSRVGSLARVALAWTLDG